MRVSMVGGGAECAGTEQGGGDGEDQMAGVWGSPVGMDSRNCGSEWQRRLGVGTFPCRSRLGLAKSNERCLVDSCVCGNCRFGFPALCWCMPPMYCVLNMTYPQSSEDTRWAIGLLDSTVNLARDGS